jgi:hypothetical protein
MKPTLPLVWLVWTAVLTGCALGPEQELFDPIDDQPPAVVATLPEDGWRQVPTGFIPRVWFSEHVDPATVWLGSMRLTSGQALTAASYQVEQGQDGRGQVILRPHRPLIPGVQYSLRITPEITDLYGNPLISEKRIQFETMD